MNVRFSLRRAIIFKQGSPWQCMAKKLEREREERVSERGDDVPELTAERAAA